MKQCSTCLFRDVNKNCTNAGKQLQEGRGTWTITFDNYYPFSDVERVSLRLLTKNLLLQ